MDAATRAREIDEALRAATTLVEATGARYFAPSIHVERAGLLGLGGDQPGRRRELVEAQRLFTEMGAVARAGRVEGSPAR